MSIKFQSSVLFVKEIAASKHFYADLLGQKVSMDLGVNVGFEGGFAIWQADYAHQTIFGLPQDQAGSLGHHNFELYFEAEDLDSVWDRIIDKNIEVVHPLREQPWGQRVFRIYDPDGHIVEVGEPMPAVILRCLAQGMTVEEVAKRTFMPEEIIQQFAQAS